jgi:tetratricopeptide (TPR) repeat protein
MKEQTEKETGYRFFLSHNKRVIFILIFLTIIVVFSLSAYFFRTKSKGQSSSLDSTETGKISAVEENKENQIVTENQAQPETAKSAEDYYKAGQELMATKSWEEAVVSFSEAIRLDNKNPDFYNRKSQAENNLGQKDKAINTLKEGIANNPNSDLLKSRLDVLQKEWYGNQEDS